MKFFQRALSFLLAGAVAGLVCEAASLGRHVGGKLDRRQAPNLVYPGNEAVMTGSFNVTSFIVPIPIQKAAELSGNYPLLPHNLPSSVIPYGHHPLLVQFGYFYDLRQDAVVSIHVEQLSASSWYIPFVDRTGTGTPFSRSVMTFQDQLVPVLVSTVTELVSNSLATFDPPHAAYKEQGGWLSATVRQGLVILGVGVDTPVFTASFKRVQSSPISESVWRSIIEQPYFTSDLTAVTGTCNGVQYLYNYPNANPDFVRGTLQLVNPKTNDRYSFDTANGYTAATQWIADPNLGRPCTDYV
ncbi:hypothetical protein ACQY0O_002015 [Thecaphora frezii]